MIDPRVALALLAAFGIWYGSMRLVHGVEKVAHKAKSAITHVIHPHAKQ